MRLIKFFEDFPEIKPMVIGVWCGNGKPENLNEFLGPFANDIETVTKDGVIINEKFRLDITIRCLVCDAPARSFLKGFNFFHSVHDFRPKFQHQLIY